jgi:hypothetical protein
VVRQRYNLYARCPHPLHISLGCRSPRCIGRQAPGRV